VYEENINNLLHLIVIFLSLPMLHYYEVKRRKEIKCHKINEQEEKEISENLKAYEEEKRC